MACLARTARVFVWPVPADVPIHNQYISPENLVSQQYLANIKSWTDKKKMKLNVEKTKTMIFNFTDKYQFSTRLLLDGAPLEIVDKAKLLGTIIENDLSWDENIKSLVKKAYQRTTMLHYLLEYNPPIEDLLTIYKLVYI